jgi:ABC-type Na+ efflux pump permease subunit
VTPTPGSNEYGSYDLFARGKLDDRLEEEVASGLREAIVAARVRAAGLDRQRIEAVTRVARRASVTVTKEGDRQTNKVFNMLLPGGFMFLLLMSVMIGGQNLLTTTVEEKSNRVVEILLSAVSPMQLMTGKILGHLAVGLVVMLLYGGMGIVALVSFSLLGLIDAMLIVYLLIFFLIAYLVVAAFMAAVGAAVNEMREAQTLMMPVMLLLMVPWILWMPISRDPNGALAVTLSFLPPTNSFAMLLRLTSATPPPAWQAWLSIAIGLASVYVALWAAAKVFRIGLLLYGKPPNLATFVRWIRMA